MVVVSPYVCLCLCVRGKKRTDLVIGGGGVSCIGGE